MLCFVVLFSVFAAVFAQEDAGCCTPDQWEGYAGELTALSRFFGRGRLIGDGITLSYDYKNKKLAETFYFNIRNKTVTASFIFDFANNKVYRFYKAKKYCKSRSIKGQFKRFCIPKGAKYLGNYYVGAGSSTLQLQSYAFGIPKLKFGISTSVSKGCIPVSEVIVGERRRVRFMTTVGFANITPGIKNPAVFTPPAYCKSEFKEFESEIHKFDSEIDELEVEVDRMMVDYIHSRFME